MALSTITARVNELDKIAFDSFCTSVGLNTSTAVNLFVKAVLREKRIPFEISDNTDPFYSESNIHYLEEKMEDYKSGNLQFEKHAPFYSQENQSYVLKSVKELRDGKGKVHELIEED